MAVHITAAGTTILDAVANLRVTVNTALTGTITISDQSGPGGASVVIAVITNPGVGNSFVYNGLTGRVTVVASAIADITLSIINY